MGCDIRILSEVAAEQLLHALRVQNSRLDFELVKTIAESKHALVTRVQKVLVFLFTTLAAIALALHTTEPMDFIGVKLEADAFAFVGFSVGNVLYVVNTGLFHKMLVFEHFLLKIIKDPKYQSSRELSAFLAFDPINIFAFYRLFKVASSESRNTPIILATVDLYTKLVVLVLYGLFYYYILANTMIRFWESQNLIYFWTLVGMNVLAIITSLAIFYPLVSKRAPPATLSGGQ